VTSFNFLYVEMNKKINWGRYCPVDKQTVLSNLKILIDLTVEGRLKCERESLPSGQRQRS
jgi:hypothetical protein